MTISHVDTFFLPMLSQDVISYLPFFSIGKKALTIIENYSHYDMFDAFEKCGSSHDEMARVGEKLLLNLYSCKHSASLDKFRYILYTQKVSKMSRSFNLTDRPVALEQLLLIISCGCKQGWENWCKCRKGGMFYTTMCLSCIGQTCTNSCPPDGEDDLWNQCS